MATDTQLYQLDTATAREAIYDGNWRNQAISRFDRAMSVTGISQQLWRLANPLSAFAPLA